MFSAPVAGGSTIRSQTGVGPTGLLEVEPEDGGFAILKNVLLALDPHLAQGARLGPAAGVDKLLPTDDLGLDEAALEVAVDGPRRLRRARAATNRPRPALG